MNFIIQETGEMKSVYFPDENTFDVSEEIACNVGFDPNEFTYDNERGGYIAPEIEVSYWVDFFEIYRFCEEELCALRDRYECDEINDILFSEMANFDIEVYKDAVEETKAILQKRFDTTKAQLISSYSLYQRDDGTYFLAGEKSYSLSKRQAREWLARHRCREELFL